MLVKGATGVFTTYLQQNKSLTHDGPVTPHGVKNKCQAITSLPYPNAGCETQSVKNICTLCT